MSLDKDVLAQANMTQTQLMMWTGQMLSGKRPVYNMGFRIDIHADLDPELFRRAFRDVVDASDILRSVFRYVDGGPRREVQPPGSIEFEIPVLDFSGKPQEAAGWMQEQIVKPINLKKRLFNTALLRTGPESFAWYLCQHHLICDGWSTSNFIMSVGDRYAQLEAGDNGEFELPAFGEFVEREVDYYLGEEAAESGQYWEEVAEHSLPDLSMYGVGEEAGASDFLRVHRALGPELINGMKEAVQARVFPAFSVDQGLFLMMLTALVVQLRLASGNDLFAIGVCLHHRRTPREKQTIGPFFVFSAVRVRFEPDDTFRTLYDRVAREYRKMLRHYRHPVVAQPGGRVWDVTINFVNKTFPRFAGRKAGITWLQSGSYLAQEFVGLQIHHFNEGDGMTAEWDFNLGIFDSEARRETAMSDFEQAMRFGLASPDAPLAEHLEVAAARAAAG